MPPEPRQERDGGLWGVQEGVDPPRKRLLGADTAEKPNLALSQETRERGGSAGELCVAPKVGDAPAHFWGEKKRQRRCRTAPKQPQFTPFPQPFPLASCAADGAARLLSRHRVPLGTVTSSQPEGPRASSVRSPRHLRKVFWVEKPHFGDPQCSSGDFAEMPPRPKPWGNDGVDPEEPKLTPYDTQINTPEHPWVPSAARRATPLVHSGH